MCSESKQYIYLYCFDTFTSLSFEERKSHFGRFLN